MIPPCKIVLIFCLIGALAGHAGCSKPETPKAKPEIVRKKINPTAGESVKTETVPAAVSASPGAPSQKPELVRNKIADKPQSDVKATPVSGSGTLPASSPRQLPGEGAPTDIAPNKTAPGGPVPFSGQVASSSPVGGFYDPAGKIDPFVPLLKDDPVKDISNAKPKKEKREPTTPLERVDLSQLKLTAIVRTPSGFKAMVEETTGKGYIVTVGTYVGTHSGRVTNILKDRIVVEEEVEDALGNVSNRNSELKFQKPSGDL